MEPQTSSTNDKHPLPLTDTLRDLALLRSSDVDLASLLPPNQSEATSVDENAELVRRSYEFVKEARAAIRLQNNGELDRQGEKVDRVREGLEEVAKGLDA